MPPSWQPGTSRSCCGPVSPGSSTPTCCGTSASPCGTASTPGSSAACARNGVDLILHSSFIDEPTVAVVVASGAALCPTWTFLANLVDYGHKVGASPRLVDLFRAEIEATAAGVRLAYEAGVKV